MSSSPREYIVAQIGADIPAKFKFADGIPTLNTLAQPTAWVEYTGFGPLDEAPTASVAAVASLCMVSHRQELTKAQADIDDDAWNLYLAIAAKDVFYAVTASKEVFEDTYLGWRINLTTIYTLTDTEDTEE